MAWSGGTFTRANGATEWQDDAALGIGIEAGLHDAQDNDLATGINTCLTKDGQNTPTANLPMGGFKHTGAGVATANGQYLTYDQVNDASPIKIDFANDRLGLNTSTPAFTLDVNSTGNLGEAIARFDNTSGGAGLFFRKSRGAAIGTNTIVSASDTIGTINFQGANGTGFDTAAQIYAFVDGTPGAATDMPGGLIFSTTPDASATPAERMRITSAGNVGIGRTNPGTYGNLEVGGSAYAATGIVSSSASGAVLILAANGASETRINTNTNHPMVFYTNNTSRMTLTAAGNLTMNTAGATIGGDFSNATVNSKNAIMTATNNDNSLVDIIPNGTATVSGIYCHNNSARTNSGYVAITSSSTINALISDRHGSGSFLPLAAYTNGTERWRLDTSGNFMIGTANTDPVANNVTGVAVGPTGSVNIGRASAAGLFISRRTTDGNLVEFYSDHDPGPAVALIGSIQNNGGVISYLAFCGSHWSQLQDNTAPTIAIGTVIESINEMCEWPGETENRLPKAKISDVTASTAIYGVFVGWDTDWTATNDMIVASVGAYLCRVAAGTVLQIGDLLESAGNGMAQVQADDIIRSSTIGKVTALTQSHVEADGSFCVPTVLYCG